LFHGGFNVVLSLLSILNIMTYAVIFPYLLYLNPAMWDKLQKLLFLGVVLCLLSPLMPNTEIMDQDGRFQGPFARTTPATAFLLISTVFLFPEKRRDVRWYILPIIIVLQVLTRTRSSLVRTLLVVVSMFYYFVKSGRYYYFRRTVALLIVLGAVVVLSFSITGNLRSPETLEFLRLSRDDLSEQSRYNVGDRLTRYVPGLQGSWFEAMFADRLHHWSLAVDRVGKKPWFGYGLGFMFTGSADDSPEETGYNLLLQPHNLFLSAAQIGGLPFLAIIFTIFVVLVCLVLKSYRCFHHLSVRQAKAVSLIGVTLIGALVGSEWFMPASIVDKFWWLAVGYICMDRRICSGRYSAAINMRHTAF